MIAVPIKNEEELSFAEEIFSKKGYLIHSYDDDIPEFLLLDPHDKDCVGYHYDHLPEGAEVIYTHELDQYLKLCAV